MPTESINTDVLFLVIGALPILLTIAISTVTWRVAVALPQMPSTLRGFKRRGAILRSTSSAAATG